MNMKTALALGAMACAAGSFAGTAKDSMTNDVNVVMEKVETAQRYPWNGKVDIDFKFACDEPTAFCFVHFNAEYEDANGATVALPMKTFEMNGEPLSYPWATTAGTYRVTWNSTADAPNVVATNVKYTVTANMAKYMIVNLASNTVSYMEECPDPTRTDHGWTYADKTSNMVFRLIQPGTFGMGQTFDNCGRWDEPRETVTISRPFYCAVFELTVFQFQQIFGSDWGIVDVPTKPANRLSYTIIRSTTGKRNGSGTYLHDNETYWATTGSKVSENSVVGKLRARLGGDMGYDLPTEAEWEYVAREGATDYRSFHNGGMTRNQSASGNPDAWGGVNTSLTDIAWYAGHTGPYENSPQPVGGLQPNSWGIYDLAGNVGEFVLDRYFYYSSARSEKERIDPIGILDEPTANDTYLMKGGGFTSDPYECDAAWRGNQRGIEYYNEYKPGCRLVWRFPRIVTPAE